jgi:hypothetical protein
LYLNADGIKRARFDSARSDFADDTDFNCLLRVSAPICDPKADFV